MKKDELKGQVEGTFRRFGNNDLTPYELRVRILELINQLDEPETLSEYWIEQKSIDTHVDTLNGEVQVTFRLDDLQNLLVPEQELPVIPKFVAEWIESRKNNYPFDVIGVYIRMNESFANEQTREVLSWVHESKLNRGSFARAWLDGYTVEEEQKYVVEIGKSIYNTTTYGQIGEVNGQKIMLSVYASEEGMIIPNKYTKQEILKVKNGMDIFKDYAVKVEEMEE